MTDAPGSLVSAFHDKRAAAFRAAMQRAADTASGGRRSAEAALDESACARRDRFRTDFLGFCRHYLPHYFTLEPSQMHGELAAEFLRMLRSPSVERFGFAAPRSNAKTTLLLAFLLFCICYRLKHFAIFITSTAELADVFLGDLMHELEENEHLAVDFPEATGRGPVWRQNVCITRNNVRVQALGAGKKIRGRKHRQHRPDLFVLDDLEDDEHVRNLDQRD